MLFSRMCVFFTQSELRRWHLSTFTIYGKSMRMLLLVFANYVVEAAVALRAVCSTTTDGGGDCLLDCGEQINAHILKM